MEVLYGTEARREQDLRHLGLWIDDLEPAVPRTRAFREYQQAQSDRRDVINPRQIDGNMGMSR